MNTPEVIALIIVPGVIALAVLLVVASAREWLDIRIAVSVKPVPGAKRGPKKAAGLKVIPGFVEPDAAVKTIGAAG